jgi:hypothetical protein
MAVVVEVQNTSTLANRSEIVASIERALSTARGLADLHSWFSRKRRLGDEH